MHLNNSCLFVIFLLAVIGCSNSHTLIDNTECFFEQDSYEILLNIKNDPDYEIFIESSNISYINQDTSLKSIIIDFFGYSSEDGQELEIEPKGKWCIGKLKGIMFTAKRGKSKVNYFSFPIINKERDRAVMELFRHGLTTMLFLRKNAGKWEMVDELILAMGG